MTKGKTRSKQIRSGRKIKVVVVGGGNGSAIVLQALKKFADSLEITAVIGTADSGGSSGELRREFGLIPSGDILRAILALSPTDYKILRKIFYEVRFSVGGKLNKHNLGNLFLTLGGQYSKNIVKTINALSESVGALGKVIPATLKPADLAVELENGLIIRGEANIDVPKYNRNWKINKALPTRVRVNPTAVSALSNADYIIFGPGSLYTSVIAPLTISGIYQSVKKSRARLIGLITNYNHIFGETGPTNLSGTIAALENNLPRPLDVIVFNSHQPDVREKKFARQKTWYLLERDDKNLTPYRSRLKFYDCGYKKFPGLDFAKLGKYLKKIIN
ncbi:MAG: hypothetical protein A2538_02485 [Candidatus Magasanikbacteria bacterium RIFOXYD2_FULL_41_14]|uniref:Gluconeogenesis factor n=1 Tax=Candidatus Magasanikbacteria bacterium RIFOXYD2_FULL_41_14 TaxID=1798709 RepID=A0A1F6PC75_9BACT|nr:MAG: hypothetical protein A2538_02485 [Candidatus Magasanikbacteria bacterium RIFOXYD2_FULL_41_14]